MVNAVQNSTQTINSQGRSLATNRFNRKPLITTANNNSENEKLTRFGLLGIAATGIASAFSGYKNQNRLSTFGGLATSVIGLATLGLSYTNQTSSDTTGSASIRNYEIELANLGKKLNNANDVDQYRVEIAEFVNSHIDDKNMLDSLCTIAISSVYSVESKECLKEIARRIKSSDLISISEDNNRTPPTRTWAINALSNRLESEKELETLLRLSANPKVNLTYRNQSTNILVSVASKNSNVFKSLLSIKQAKSNDLRDSAKRILELIANNNYEFGNSSPEQITNN